jgi:hypothetical protein
MFDVQSFHCSGQAEFHTSTASGLKSGQSDHQETFVVSYKVSSNSISRVSYKIPPEHSLFFDQTGRPGGQRLG